AFLRPVARPVLTWGPGDRWGDADPLLLAAHARDPGRDHRPDHAPPLPRDPARRHVAAVVEGRRGGGAGRGGAGVAAAWADAARVTRRRGVRDAGRARRARLVAAIPKEKPSRVDEARAQFA